MELVYRDDVENVKCEEVTEEEANNLISFAEEMIEFCVKSGGLGLAAPQAGLNKKMFVWKSKNDEVFEIGFNPTFYPDGKQINTIEGCLSYPDENYFVQRRKAIRAVYYSLNKGGKLVKVARKMTGEEAIIFQHEVAHINGQTVATEGRKL